MCTEFLLALIYFIILFAVNFLVGKLLVSYKKSLLFQLKLKNIFTFFEKKNLSLLFFLEKNQKNESKFSSLVEKIKNFSKTKDILIIGNIYKKFSIFEKKKINSSSFYFLLLQQQYIAIKEIE